MLPSVYDVLSLCDIGCTEEVEETGVTLEENSLLKAQHAAAWMAAHGLTDVSGVFADDTGLEVEALDGRPGVHTARYAGEPADDAANRRKLLEELARTGDKARRACFRTVVTLLFRNRVIRLEGQVDGIIASAERGTGGFGYDSLFIPAEGDGLHFAEMSAAEKNLLSHRGRAMTQLKQTLQSLTAEP